MEKVIIKDVKDTGKKYKGKKPPYKESSIIEITLSDGRKGVCFDERENNFIEGEEVEFNIKEAPENNGEKRYYFNIPRPAYERAERKTRRDYQFEKKKTAIEVSKDLIVAGKLNPDQLISSADKIMEWMNK